MAKVFALEVSEVAYAAPHIELLFDVRVVDQNTGTVAGQEMPIYIAGHETPDEFRDAVVAQLTSQIGMYFPSLSVAPSDFVIVNVQRGA